MSQEQPQRPEAVTYGDVFDVHGEIASKPITPQDAATLQSAENLVLGQVPKGGPAAVMQSAANTNERMGLVGHGDMTEVVKEKGATISQARVAGYEVVTEAVGGQVIGQYGAPVDVKMKDKPSGQESVDPITIGEALEATALSAGEKPIEPSDVAAIQAAEARATGLGRIVPGGIASEAQSAAARNMQVTRDEDKAKLGDILSDATEKLIDDKPVTREVAESVISAEIRNKPDLTTYPGGVGASMTAAANLNQDT